MLLCTNTELKDSNPEMPTKQASPDPHPQYGDQDQRKPVLYVVDDEKSIGEFIAYAAEDAGFDVQVLCSAYDLQDKWEECIPDVVVMDIIMPGIDGIELVSWLAKKHYDLPTILMSGYDTRYINLASQLADALQVNIVASLHKPISLVTLITLLKRLERQFSDKRARH